MGISVFFPICYGQHKILILRKQMKFDLRINDRKTFWILLLVLSLWKVLLAWKLDVCSDEGYYFYWSLFPQLSYFDHPPLTSWAMALSHKWFGDTIWTVRCWPLIVGVLFAVAGRALAREMFDAGVGNRAGIFLILCPVFAGNGLLMTPDTLFALFWCTALYATWKALENPSRELRWWSIAGVSAGLGLLSKYNMVLFFLGLGFLWLVSPGKRRKIFYGLVMSGGIALVVFLPVLVWNFENDWISFRFQLQHGFSGDGFKPWVTFPRYLGGLMLVATPLLGGLAFWRSSRAIFSADEPRKFLGVFFWVVVLFFAISGLKGKVSANWPMMAFFSGVILVAADWRLCLPWLRRATVGLLVFVLLLGLSYLSLPNDFAIAVGGRSLDIPRMKEFIGGKQVADAVRRKRKELNLDFICVARDPLFGELAFYAPDLRSLLWLRELGSIRFPWIDHQGWRGKSALLVSHRPKSWPMFQKVHALGQLDIPYKKYLKRTLYFYKGVGYQPERSL